MALEVSQKFLSVLFSAAAPAAKETHLKMEQINKIKQMGALGHITPLH